MSSGEGSGGILAELGKAQEILRDVGEHDVATLSVTERLAVAQTHALMALTLAANRLADQQADWRPGHP
jgi:hypothetical protein